MCLKALIRNVTFPAVQNFLHIYAEQDLRAPNAVMEPSGLNKMSTRIELKLFAAELLLGANWATAIIVENDFCCTRRNILNIEQIMVGRVGSH